MFNSNLILLGIPVQSTVLKQDCDALVLQADNIITLCTIGCRKRLVGVMRYNFPREGVACMYIHSDKIAGKEEQTSHSMVHAVLLYFIQCDISVPARHPCI